MYFGCYRRDFLPKIPVHEKPTIPKIHSALMANERKLSEDNEENANQVLNETEYISVAIETQTKTCFVCQEILENEFYRCLTCVESETVANLYCEACITSPHIKKRHHVTDYRGYEPKICEKHRLLSSIYCASCDAVVCCKCREHHITHDCEKVSSAASKVRRNVFQNLETIDQLIKPLKKRKVIAEDIVTEIANFSSSVSSENFSQTFIGSCRRILETKSSEWSFQVCERLGANEECRSNAKQLITESSTISETADNQWLQLISLLQISDAVCIEKSQHVLKNSISLTKEQQEVLGYCIFLQWVPPIDVLMEASLEGIAKALQQPAVVAQKLETIIAQAEPALEIKIYKINLVDSGRNMGFLSHSFGPFSDKRQIISSELRPNIAKITLLNEKCDEMCTEIHFRVPNVTHSFACGSMLSFFTNQRNAIYVNLTTGRYSTELTFPSHLEPIKFYSFYGDERNVFSVWDSTRSTVVFLHKREHCGCVALKKRPKIMKKYENYYAFIDDENLVTFYNKLTGDRLEISAPYHGMNQIDNLLFFNGMDHVVLVDYHSNIFTWAEIEFSNSRFSSWRINKVYKAELPPDEKTIFATSFENKIITCTKSKFFAVFRIVENNPTNDPNSHPSKP